MMLTIIDTIILWTHLFSAVVFVGGSFFIWFVVVPASYHFAKDEAERTQIVGKIAKSFANIANITLIILVLTGIYNISWYLPSYKDLFEFQTFEDKVLFTKIILVIALISLIYLHGVYYGKKISKFALKRDVDGLRAVRRKSRVISYTNLALMIIILALATMLQMAT